METEKPKTKSVRINIAEFNGSIKDKPTAKRYMLYETSAEEVDKKVREALSIKEESKEKEPEA